jgi:hypothetical protein
MRFHFNNLRRTFVGLVGGAALVVGAAGVGFAQKPAKGDKQDLKEHQKLERSALRTHQRDERERGGNTRAQREHWKAERSDLKRHEKWEKASLKRDRRDDRDDRSRWNRRTSRGNTGAHYSTARGYFRDRGRRAYRNRH